MMLNLTKLGAWAGALLAVLALCGAALTGAKWLIAQEAQKQMAPVQEQVETLIEQNRQQLDWDKLVYCVEKQHQDKTAEERERICKAESEQRWKEWRAEDEAKKDPQ